MSVAAPAYDRLSLTLPDWRGALAKIKRKAKPPRHPFFYVWMTLSALDLSFAFIDAASGKYVRMGLYAIDALVAWRIAMLYRKMPPHEFVPPGTEYLKLVGVIWIVFIAMLVSSAVGTG